MADPLPPDTRPRVRDDLVFRPLGEEWVVYDPRTRDLHVLNVTAAAVWACCDGSLTPAEMAVELEAHLEAAPPTAEVRRDVDRALARFADEGLLA